MKKEFLFFIISLLFNYYLYGLTLNLFRTQNKRKTISSNLNEKAYTEN